jgi:hypothetical protein
VDKIEFNYILERRNAISIEGNDGEKVDVETVMLDFDI